MGKLSYALQLSVKDRKGGACVDTGKRLKTHTLCRLRVIVTIVESETACGQPGISKS